MADTIVTQDSDLATVPTLTEFYAPSEAGGTSHFPVEFISGGSAGAWTFQLVDATHGLPSAVVAEVASSLVTGAKSAIGATALQLVGSSVPAAHGVCVKASNGNGLGVVYVGPSTVTAGTTDATDGMELGAGESFTFPVNDVSLLWAVGSTTGLKVYWVAT